VYTSAPAYIPDPLSNFSEELVPRLACTQPNGNPDNSGHLKETGNGSQRSDLDVDDDYSAPGTEIANVTQ